MLTRLLLFLSLATALSAQDGGQLFTLYCSACHGADGNGATGGAFPPLAGSPWLKGDGDRATKIVLRGLEGPIQVLGNRYNLAMPPQSAVLADDQIAAILTHVRSSWGHAESPVTADQVTKIRAATADHPMPWTPEEILHLHPLPLEKTPLKNLTSQVFLGDWPQLPDLSKLKPESVEEEHSGILSIKQAPRKDHFAYLWQGDFEAPVEGQYYFLLDADDSARVYIDGKRLLEVRGIGAMDGTRKKSSKLKLTPGPHAIRIEFFEFMGNEGIALGWKGPKMNEWEWLSESHTNTGPQWPSIPIEPSADRAVIYRNFINGASARGIGVGFPGGVNLAYSADHFAPELVWTGKFMDGGHHWTDRGVGYEAPAGEQVIKLSNESALPVGAKFRGYQLDAAGNPTFAAQVGSATVLDTWQPAHSGQPALIRRLAVTGGGPAVKIILSDILNAKAAKNGDLSFNGQLFIHIEGAKASTTGKITSLPLSPGQSATLTYRWNP